MRLSKKYVPVRAVKHLLSAFVCQKAKSIALIFFCHFPFTQIDLGEECITIVLFVNLGQFDLVGKG
jgi:hypothetical protein